MLEGDQTSVMFSSDLFSDLVFEICLKYYIYKAINSRKREIEDAKKKGEWYIPGKYIHIHFPSSGEELQFSIYKYESDYEYITLKPPQKYTRQLLGVLLRKNYEVKDYIVYDSGFLSDNTGGQMLCGWDVYYK